MRRIALLLALVPALVLGAGVPRSEVFPVERLPAELRAEAEATLLRAMDREALFTIIGGLKPMSSGWSSVRIDVEKPDVEAMERLRQIARVMRVGDEVTSAVQPFWRVFEGRRFLEGVVFHRRSFSDAVRRQAPLFGFWGVSPSSEPIEVLMAFETDATPRRNRAFGVLFGYPEHAIDFFVEAQDSQRRTGNFVERDFLSIPTFERPTNAFVYAVPKGHTPNAADLALRNQAEPILAMYRSLRARYVGEGKPGIVQLIRDWMDDGTGRCSPATALRKALQNAPVTKK